MAKNQPSLTAPAAAPVVELLYNVRTNTVNGVEYTNVFFNGVKVNGAVLPPTDPRCVPYVAAEGLVIRTLRTGTKVLEPEGMERQTQCAPIRDAANAIREAFQATAVANARAKAPDDGGMPF